MGDEGTYYVVDEDRAAVVAGPFDDQEDARDDASDRTPGHIVAGSRVLDTIEMSSNQTLRWENSEDDVDIVTDGGVVQKQAHPDAVPAFWGELTPAGKRIYLEDHASKNEALILVVHELGLDVDISDIDTSQSLIHSEWLSRVFGELLALEDISQQQAHHVDVEWSKSNGAGNEGDTPEETSSSDDNEERDLDEDVPERAGVEDLRDRVDGDEADGRWIREAFEDVENLGESVISRVEDAGYTHIGDLKEATAEELQENVQYVGESKADRLIGLANSEEGETTESKDDDADDEEVNNDEHSDDADDGGNEASVESAEFEDLETPAWLDESSFYQAAEISDDIADFESTLGWDEGHERLAELVEATGADVEVSI